MASTSAPAPPSPAAIIEAITILASSTSSPRARGDKRADSGFIYAFRIPFIQVTIDQKEKAPGAPEEEKEAVVDSNESVGKKWSLVKIGRVDPGHLEARLKSHGDLLTKKTQHVQGVRIGIPKKGLAVPIPKRRRGQKVRNHTFQRHLLANWHHEDMASDMLFVLPADIGRERELRERMGISFSKHPLKTVPEDMDAQCYTKSRLKAQTGFRNWILGRDLRPENQNKTIPQSLGETEWVVMPESLCYRLKEARLRTSKELDDFFCIQEFEGVESGDISITFPGRAHHQTLTFSSFSLPKKP